MDPAIAALALEALYLTALLSIPVLAAALLAGVLSSASHSVLGLRDTGALVVPRVILVCAAAALTGPWVAQELIAFTRALWALFP